MMYVTKIIGKLAVTHYSVQKVIGQASLVRCVLETDRTHQIEYT
ncbi:hypothetical protein [Wolbachia endosymbiont of Wuchereria bancrofti]|nr:hypothetical protein [Wolbachia endosymbiont of Wuchereria bancrofti]